MPGSPLPSSPLVRRAARRAAVLCAALAVAAGGVVLTNGHSGTSAPARLGPDQLLLAGAKGTGVTVTLTVLSPTGTSVQNAPSHSVQFGVGAGVSSPGVQPREKSEAMISELVLTRSIDASTLRLLELTADQAATDLTAVITVARSAPNGTPLEQLTYRATGAALTGESESVAGAADQIGFESLSISGSDLTVTYTGDSGPAVIVHLGASGPGSAAAQAALHHAQARANQARTSGG